METLSNKHVALSFDSKTGALADIRNLATGNSCLVQAKGPGNPFAVYYDSHRTFGFPGIPNGPEPLPDPAELASKVFSPVSAEAVTIGKKGNGLSLIYRQGPWQATLSVSLAGNSSRWKLKVKNVSDQPCPMMAVFPFIGGIRLGEGRGNLMVVNDEAGYVRPLWTAGKERGGIYGQGSQMSMQWGCVFDEQSKDALAFIVEDADLRNKEIIYEKPSVQVRYFPPVILQPGQTMAFPPVRLLVYSGDWKPAAVEYHRWFRKHFKLAEAPAWVADVDSHRGRWMLRRGQEMGGLPEEAIRTVAYRASSFAELPAMVLGEPADVYELAFFSRSGMGPKASGMRFTHTDGDNVVREDLGGVRAMRAGVRGMQRLGSRFTLYIEGYIVSDDAEIARDGRAHDWAVMNQDGSNCGVYTQYHHVHMCPGAAGWQDHLARTCAELVRRTGADGIRLDSLGAYFFPCYNPKHRHESPFDYNKWLCQLLEKVAKAVRKVNPECLLTTELPVDFFRQHFHGALTQFFNDAPVAITRDVCPMRVALPEYHVIMHCPHGPVSASLAGYPGGSLYWNDPQALVGLEQKWRAARFPVADVLRWGDAAHDNPRASRADVACRRFSGKGVDVVVGARYQYPKGRHSGHVAKNSHIDIRSDRITFDVHLEHMPRKPKRVYLIDIVNRAVREIRPKGDRFAIDCNWFVLVVMYDRDEPLAWMDTPSSCVPGGELELNVTLIGGQSSRRIRADLKAPSLKLDQTITIPGPARLRLGKDVEPGTHLVTLRAKGMLGARCFVTVDAP